MHPAFSVIFLTTLIGVGQGLFLALFTVESYAAFGLNNKIHHQGTKDTKFHQEIPWCFLVRLVSWW